MDEQIFETLAKDTLRKIADSIELAAQAADSDLDVDLDNSVLTIELENDQIFLINKHAPLKQIWVSSPVSGASHYVWKEEACDWICTRRGISLAETLVQELLDTAGIQIILDK